MRCLALGLFLAILYSQTVNAYSFICNGLHASGVQRKDNCGPCDDDHAPRWNSRTLQVFVGLKVVPAGFSSEEWWEIVKESFKAWENVPGVNLRFELTKGEGMREFGANESVHELFVITDHDEWIKKVGAGPAGVLGATLPKYTCTGDNTNDPFAFQEREIVDSDLVINGTGCINWQKNCKSEDCVDPRTTLTHEIGHWFGLDHPCLSCSTSIMSARAGFSLIYPVFDDMQGIRALYPDGTTGGFGTPCEANSECNNNLCLSDKNLNYCSNSCEKDEDCHGGARCQERNGLHACFFEDGVNNEPRREGESCDFTPCVEPLVCAGASKESFYCFKPCGKNISCKSNQECIKVGKETSICVTIKQLGESCDGHELCNDSLFCLIEDNTGNCRAPCGLVDPNGTGCEPGFNCKVFGLRQEICVPDMLSLTNSSALGFNDTQSTDKLSRYDKAPPSSQKSSACNSINLKDSNMSFLWALAALVFFRLLRTRARFL